MKKQSLLIFVITTLVCMVLSGCGKGNSIVGTWERDDGEEVLIFENDGSCSVPFTYDGGWLESCDRYSIDDEGTLTLSSSRGNIDSERYTKQDSEDDVYENGGYYLHKNTLVISDYRSIYTYTQN